MKSMKSSNKPIFDCLLISKSLILTHLLQIFVQYYVYMFLGDFCGRPKWWFRTPKAIPAPYAACDKCCKTENPDKMNVIFYTEEDNFAELCRIDMVKWLSDDNRE